MEYILFLIKEGGAFNSRLLAIALLSSMGEGVIVSTIITAAHESGMPNSSRFFLFLSAFLLYVVAHIHVLNSTSKLIEEAIQRVRFRIASQLCRAELINLEAVTKTSVQQVVAQDCQTMYDSSREVMFAMAGLGLVVGCLVNMALLSIDVVKWLFAALSLLTLLFIHRQRTVRSEYDKAAQEDERFFKIISDQLDGFKDLWIHDDKAADLIDNDVRKTTESAAKIKFGVARKLNAGVVLNQGFFFALLAFIVFVVPKFIDPETIPISKVTSIVIFMMTPLYDFMVAFPALVRASGATRRLLELEAKLEAIVSAGPNLPPVQGIAFESLRCEQLTFYRSPPKDSLGENFRLGPFNLQLRRGEILFIVGKNGSGKSTLLHLLCGLYAPSRGRVFVNEQLATRSQYRALFSIVLQDHHLFPRLLGRARIKRERVNHLRRVLGLENVTDIRDDGTIANLNLSRGQAKRLALIVAECEDREIFLFDEWAAEQDSACRRYFYEVYLKELKARGKTIVAVTHDDNYLHVADRVLEIHGGQLLELGAAGAEQRL